MLVTLNIRESIALHLLKIVFGSYFFVALAVTAVQLVLEYQNTKTSIYQEIQTLPQTFGKGLSNSVWIYNEELLASILEGMFEIPIVVGVEVITNDHKTHLAVGNILDENKAIQYFPPQSNSTAAEPKRAKYSSLFSYEFPIVFRNDETGQKTTLGIGRIYSSDELVVERVKYGFMLILINSIIKTAALWIILWFVLRNIIAKPLKRLTFAINGIKFNNLSAINADINTTKRNEIKVLEEAFNVMIHRLDVARAELQELNQSLEQKVQERTQEVELTLSDLRTSQARLIQAEKMASLGQLVTNVAHEINTPIGAVKSSGDSIATALDEALTNLPRIFEILDPQARNLFTQLVGQSLGATVSLTSREERAIKNAVDKQLEEAGIEGAEGKARILVKLRAHVAPLDYLSLLTHPECNFILDTAQTIGSIIDSTKNIDAAVARVSKIVTTLKSFSLVDSFGEMTGADLKDGIESVVNIYSNQIKQGTQLVREYEDIPSVRCLPDELRLVWTHLIHNALQAMAYKGTLTIALKRVGNEAVVSISDTGSGIPKDIQWRIFEPFFTTRPKGEGAGLGLDIVKKIVNKHMGRVEFQTEVGVGSTFSIYLPYPVETAGTATNAI